MYYGHILVDFQIQGPVTKHLNFFSLVRVHLYRPLFQGLHIVWYSLYMNHRMYTSWTAKRTISSTKSRTMENEYWFINIKKKLYQILIRWKRMEEDVFVICFWGWGTGWMSIMTLIENGNGEGHQWVINTARKSRNRRRASACPETNMFTS